MSSDVVPQRRTPPRRSAPDGYDAVVIGAGPNGLVAANVLAERGWSVLVLEAEPDPGGAVRSSELIEPGFTVDRFSAFYPLSAVSPHLTRLHLERHGLHWDHAPSVLAHPQLDGPTALLDRDVEVTAASLERFAGGDGSAWRQLDDEWSRLEPVLVDLLFSPFPPLRAAARLVRLLGLRESGELLRTVLLPVRRLAEERFAGAGAALLLAGCALHADLTPDASTSGFLGWLLAGIGQRHGWPVPRGGAGALTDALVRRLEHHGGSVRCNARVTNVEVRDGRAVAVRTADGSRVAASRAVVADVVAPSLFGRLIDPEHLPATLLRDLLHYQRGAATFKVNWTLNQPVPWSDPAVGRAGTVHLAESLDELTVTAGQLSMGVLAADPFVLVGQMTTADATRSPAGTETLWAYTNVPQHIRRDAAGELAGLSSPDDAERYADRLQARIERFAPGFTATIRGRQLQTPADLERDDANLLGGDKSLGTAQVHQQLIFRPTVGLARTETPVAGLFMASASAHPGGGVHGACGANAARAAVAADARRRARRVFALGAGRR